MADVAALRPLLCGAPMFPRANQASWQITGLGYFKRQ